MNFEEVFSHHHRPRISRYETYWDSIAPENNNEIFQRWLFAYTSIHSTWESNVRCYNYIKNFESWIDSKECLTNLLLDSRAGLQNQRTESIWDFKNKFFECPDRFKKSRNEDWTQFRNKLCHSLRGIGLAKVSFALELCYPNNVEVVCLDVHMLRALGYDTRGYRIESKKELAEYQSAEKIWLDKSKKFGTSPYITRCLYWDIIQGKPDSRYWSHCLESQLCLEI